MLEKILKEEKIPEEVFDDGLAAIIGNPKARTVLWVLLAQSGYFSTGAARDAHSTAILAGKRETGIFILDCLDALDVDALAIMREDARRRHMDAHAEEKEEEKEEKERDIYDPPDDKGDWLDNSHSYAGDY